MIPVLLPVAIVGYLVSIVLAVVVTMYRSKAARNAASITFVLTWLVHLAAVLQQGILSGRVPLSNLSEYLLVLGWTVMALHLYVWFRLRVDVAGAVLPPIAVICAFCAWLLASETITESSNRGG